MAVSAASLALDELLKTDEQAAKVLRAELHRTMLWRYSNGERKPVAHTAALIERLSGGKVPANGWEDIEFPSEAAPPTGSAA